MTTEAQRRAHAAYVERLKAEGYGAVTLRLSADLRERVGAYAKANKLSAGKAYETLVTLGLAASDYARHRADAERLIREAEPRPMTTPAQVLGDPAKSVGGVPFAGNITRKATPKTPKGGKR